MKKILQRLANDEQEESDHEHQTNSNEENAEEAQLLKKEAEVPIEELLKRYNGEEKHFHSPNITKRILPNNEEKIDPPTEPIAEVWLIDLIRMRSFFFQRKFNHRNRKQRNDVYEKQ